MTRRETMRMLAAVLAAGALACDGTTGPEGGGAMTDLPLTHDMEMQVVGDSDVSDLLVEGLALHAGRNPDDAQFRAGTDCFREARQLLRAGEAEAARERARDCRTMMVQVAIESHGERAVDEMFARVEVLVERIEEADDEFARLADVGVRIRGLLDEARARRANGDLVGAGERLMLALQLADRMRHRHPTFVADPRVHVRIAIARSGEALRLAEDLIEAPSQLQERVLFRASEHHRRALFALDQGWHRRALIQARHAEQLALYAVLDGAPPTVEEAQALLLLANEMIAAAEAAVGPEPTEAEQALLRRAVRLRDRGAQAIDAWRWRGVSLLWHSAVTAGILVPDGEGEASA